MYNIGGEVYMKQSLDDEDIKLRENDIAVINEIIETDKSPKTINNGNKGPKKKKKRKLKKKTVSIILLVIAIPFLIFSLFHVVKYMFFEVPQTKKLIKDIEANTEIKEYDSEDAEIIESDELPDSPYWNFIKMKLIDVNFDSLLATNSDTVGWVTVGGTNVNYPIVQTGDNDYYLTHAFDKSKNSAGWVFMDYRNNKNSFGRNTIIYGHNRKDQTMFGSLKKVLTDAWYNTADNRVIKMSSPTNNTLWQIYSAYTIETTPDYIKTNFSSDAEYEEFLNLVKSRSKKLVVHAKLIKIEAK